jgi:SpoVK/Ycf46/Vps4 family AAA+-type ATPase
MSLPRPLPLELVEISPPCKRHAVAFAGQVTDTGASSSSSSSTAAEDCIELSHAYAECLGLRDGACVRVGLRDDIQKATKVYVVPQNVGEYSAVTISAQAIEENALAQVALVSVGGTFPLWVDRNKQLVKFTVSKIEVPGGSQHQHQQPQLSAMIGLGTELVVLDPAESASRKKRISGGAAATTLMNGKHSNSQKNSARGVTPFELRVLPLSRGNLGELGAESAVLKMKKHSNNNKLKEEDDEDKKNSISMVEKTAVWDVTKGFVAPLTLQQHLSLPPSKPKEEEEGHQMTLQVKVVPKMLEESSAVGGQNAITSEQLKAGTSLCISLEANDKIPAGHLAVAPSVVQALGIEPLQRVVLVPIGVRGGGGGGGETAEGKESPSTALSFKIEVTEVVNASEEEEDEEEQARRSQGDDSSSLTADAATCKSIVNTLLEGFAERNNDEKKTNNKPAERSCFVISEGMILEAFENDPRLRGGMRRSVKFVISKVVASSDDNKLQSLGKLEHVCVDSAAASLSDGVEFDVSLSQPTTALSMEVKDRVECLQVYRMNKRSWESSWLLSARESCTEMLRVILDRNLNVHFLKSKIPFPGGVLVHGPSGSGKTVLCQGICDYFACETNFECSKVVWMDCQSFLHMDLEKMKRQMRVFISKTVECQPALLVLDNLDVFNSSYADGQASIENFQCEVFSEYLSHLMDCVRDEHHCVAFLATARSLEAVHASLKKSGCFDNHFSMPVPSRKEKAEMYQRLARAKDIFLDDATLNCIAQNCDGLEVVDMNSLVELTLHKALLRVVKSHSSHSPTNKKNREGRLDLSVSTEDVDGILKDFVPSKARGTSHKVANDSKLKDWDDIKGMTEARAQLEDLLSFSSKYKDLMDKCPLRLRTGALLYGPPGCGKTFLVRAAASICNLRIISVKGPELLNKYIGASEAGVRELFEKASGASPCILFFDEFDAIAPKRGHDSTGVTDRVVNQFLAELDGIEALVGVFVLAATSRPDMIDPALLRPGRLDRMVYCQFPEESDRFDILCQGCKAVKLSPDVSTSELMTHIARKTPQYTGADLMGLLSEAQLGAAKRNLDGQAPLVIPADFQNALDSSRPSLGLEEVVRLTAMYSNFSDGGAPASKTAKRVTHA